MDRARALRIAGIALGTAALLGLFLIFTRDEVPPVDLPPEREAAPTAASQNPDPEIASGEAAGTTTPPPVIEADGARSDTPPPARDRMADASDTPATPDSVPPEAGGPIPLQPRAEEPSGPRPRARSSAPKSAITFCFPDVVPTPNDCADRDTVLAFATEQIGVQAPDGVTEALAVELVDPAGLAEPRTARTCEQYLSLKANGWGPLTTAAMRRDSKMNRFCGLIAMARRAEPGRGGLSKLTEALLEATPDDRWPSIGEATVENPLVLDTPGDPRIWFVQADRVEFTIRDVSAADFDGDGANEVLVFTALQAADGTAIGGGYALAEMQNGALLFKPADPY